MGVQNICRNIWVKTGADACEVPPPHSRMFHAVFKTLSRPFQRLHLHSPGSQTARTGNKRLFPPLSFLLSSLFSPGNRLSVLQERKVSENIKSSTDHLDTAYIAILPKPGLGQAHLSQVWKGRQAIDEQRSCIGKVKKQLKKSWKVRKRDDQSKENTLRTEV